MSKLFQSLQSTQAEQATRTSQSTHPKNDPLSGRRFNEESELLALAQNIAARLPHPDQNVIQFIGSQEGEGTSTLIREFALLVAEESPKPVLLVEANFKNRSQNQAFGVKDKSPLDFALKNEKALDSVITQIGQSNLFLASLSTQFFRSLTERSVFYSSDMWKVARNHFSLILIDSTPVNVSDDGLAICESVNGVILVLAAETTRAAVAQSAKKRILSREGNLLGIVYTKRKLHVPDAIHKLL